ncbi:hypothetical protein C8Q76DRAFT_708147 [Earliella scabrosa]|nr:hypothetical protein C8Q76DRAFT_708147 [Earliella scabrosa]
MSSSRGRASCGRGRRRELEREAGQPRADHGRRRGHRRPGSPRRLLLPLVLAHLLASLPASCVADTGLLLGGPPRPASTPISASPDGAAGGESEGDSDGRLRPSPLPASQWPSRRTSRLPSAYTTQPQLPFPSVF